jgi:hypothetical protein
MHPWDLQTYEADAETWLWNDQLEGGRIWMISGWSVQMPQIEKWGNLTRKREFRWGDFDLDREGLALSFNLAEASCRSDWLVEATMTSRSPISMVSEPVWGEKTDNLNRRQVSEMGKPGGPITTYAEVNVELDGD